MYAKRKKIYVPVTGHKALADIKSRVFVRRKYVAVVQMVLWGLDPGSQEPPHPAPSFLSRTKVVGQVGVLTRQHSLV